MFIITLVQNGRTWDINLEKKKKNTFFFIFLFLPPPNLLTCVSVSANHLPPYYNSKNKKNKGIVLLSCKEIISLLSITLPLSHYLYTLFFFFLSALDYHTSSMPTLYHCSISFQFFFLILFLLKLFPFLNLLPISYTIHQHSTHITQTCVS